MGKSAQAVCPEIRESRDSKILFASKVVSEIVRMLCLRITLFSETSKWREEVILRKSSRVGKFNTIGPHLVKSGRQLAKFQVFWHFSVDKIGFSIAKSNVLSSSALHRHIKVALVCSRLFCQFFNTSSGSRKDSGLPSVLTEGLKR